MKVRTDFVTNSSSSSFILAFTDEDSIKLELVNNFDGENMADFPTVYEDVMKAERLTKEQVISKFYDELGWQAAYDLYDELKRKNPSAIEDVDGWWHLSETEQGKKLIDEYIDKLVESVKVQLDENSVFVEVEYSDHDHCELEHHVLPVHPCTVIRFNHH